MFSLLRTEAPMLRSIKKTQPMSTQQKLMTNWRWWLCSLLFVATTVNYLDRQVLSLTYEEFIKPMFHWTDADYGKITSYFSIFYAIACLFAGKFVDWMGTKKGYLIAIFVWSAGACLHAACGWATMHIEGFENIEAMKAVEAGSTAALGIATTGVYLFLLCRGILALGEAGNFPAAIKVTAEYFPKKDRAFATSVFNAGASVGALAAPLTIPPLAAKYGWEMAFIIIGALGFIWMFFWQFMYDKPENSKHDPPGRRQRGGSGCSERGEEYLDDSLLRLSSDLVVHRGQVPDRRCLVVLPVLGAELFPEPVRLQSL